MEFIKVALYSNTRATGSGPQFFEPPSSDEDSTWVGYPSSRRATRPLVRLMEGEERLEASDHSQGILTQNWKVTERNRTVTCMELKATGNDLSLTTMNFMDLDLAFD
ncbi:hypothetical protein TNCV_2204291 [Trichonephila clavipes]|nr:hypothetical protein TNCV_2204291 [Trichonephila clavipes]